MFQYSAALSLSYETQSPLLITNDMSSYFNQHNNGPLDQIFPISSKRATKSDLYKVLGLKSSPILRYLLFSEKSFFHNWNFKSVVNESNFHLANKFLSDGDDLYLHGYFQSENFFIKSCEFVRSEFIFEDRLTQNCESLFNEIRRHPSASIHIRRGDYLNRRNSKLFHACDLDYYLRAMQYVASRTEKIKFYIFSDDPKWAHENFYHKGYDFCIINTISNAAAQTDMFLMSLCDHNIIANSTFSWWAAWLNSNNDKIVISPDKWFKNGRNASDLIPNSWIKI